MFVHRQGKGSKKKDQIQYKHEFVQTAENEQD